jgi:ABC-2 type transport system permease protein
MGFFVRNGINSRRTLWLGIVAAVPVITALILVLAKPWLLSGNVSIASQFPQVGFVLFLRFLLPLLAVFIGTAIIGDEVEDRTLPYLLVRPVPRAHVVLSKTLAGSLTMGLLIGISLGFTYTIMTLDGGWSHWISNVPRLFGTAGVLLIGIMVYVPLFGFLGGVMKRPVLAGLVFTFGWENAVAFFPGNVKLFTVLHYLNVLFPEMERTPAEQIRAQVFNFVLPSYRISPVLAFLILLVLSFVFFCLVSSLLNVKEYRLEQE